MHWLVSYTLFNYSFYALPLPISSFFKKFTTESDTCEEVPVKRARKSLPSAAMPVIQPLPLFERQCGSAKCDVTSGLLPNSEVLLNAIPDEILSMPCVLPRAAPEIVSNEICRVVLDNLCHKIVEAHPNAKQLGESPPIYPNAESVRF